MKLLIKASIKHDDSAFLKLAGGFVWLIFADLAYIPF